MTGKRTRDLVLMSIMLSVYTVVIYSIGASARPEIAPLSLEIAGCEVDSQPEPSVSFQQL